MGKKKKIINILIHSFYLMYTFIFVAKPKFQQRSREPIYFVEIIIPWRDIVAVLDNKYLVNNILILPYSLGFWFEKKTLNGPLAV